MHVLCTNKFLASFLIFIPFGFLSYFLDWPKWLVFTCNFFSILPMAWLIGKTTEDLASHTGEILGGLINASFGNIVEMLLCIAGIQQGELQVVKCTLVGSILSNLLLVMGSAFIYGGLVSGHKVQYYSKAGASAHSSLLLLSCLALALPTMYSQLTHSRSTLVEISRGTSVLLLFVYAQYLLFQLYTHQELFEEDKDAKRKAQGDDPDEDSDDEEDPDLTPKCAIFLLGLCTVMVTFCSEFLIGAIKGTIISAGVSKEFIGIIILPIIGNAAEHYTAIIVAGRNKMDLSLGVAVGSSCQMALLVTPFTVLVGWAVGKEMTLDFHPFQVAVLLLSVLIAANVLADGQSNWLEGSMLCCAYVTIGMIYWFEGNLDEGQVLQVPGGSTA